MIFNDNVDINKLDIEYYDKDILFYMKVNHTYCFEKVKKILYDGEIFDKFNTANGHRDVVYFQKEKYYNFPNYAIIGIFNDSFNET